VYLIQGWQGAGMTTFPCLVRSSSPSGADRYRLGHVLVDGYLEFVAGRVRPNSLRAVTFDLKVFFEVIDKEPVDVLATDVFEFLAHQRGDRRVIRLSDRESALAARTIARRLSSVAGFYAYLMARGDTQVTRNPKILAPAEVDGLMAALRTHRDRSLVLCMLLGGLRRCEALGLRLKDLWVGERRLFVAEGKGGHQRIVPVADRFFAEVGEYLHLERPGCSSDRLFVVLKGPRAAAFG
jgi:site-specific recombinase XerD